MTHAKRPLATVADIGVLCFLTVLVWLGYQRHARPRHDGIPDKLEIVVRQNLPADSLRRDMQLTLAEMDEMQYYLRIHNVTDEGYNLVAHYHTTLTSHLRELQARLAACQPTRQPAVTRRLVRAKDRPLIAVKTCGGYWRAGLFHVAPLKGKGITRDSQNRVVCALFDADTVVTATRRDSLGLYQGQMDAHLQASGQGSFDYAKGCHYEGFFQNDRRHGFGFESSPLHQVRVGEWKDDRFLGERLKYTTERIYGIDISRYQHEIGRRRYAINWRSLRITSLGKRHQTDGQTFPVSFVYIKATESTSVRNRYFLSDYASARARRIHVGAYHFFSLKTTPQAQAAYFLKYARIAKNDFPPVLDVEPTDEQIRQIGGADELMRRIRTWMQTVEKRTGKRPILYVSQSFVNKHMQNATDIKSRYNVWIARYGQYKPDVKLVYWQLCADGRVSGITGPVDINVFNGYQGQWTEFLQTGFHQ